MIDPATSAGITFLFVILEGSCGNIDPGHLTPTRFVLNDRIIDGLI